MTRVWIAAASALALLSLAGCKEQADTSAISDALKADTTQWNADWAARDAAKIASHYADDAVMMQPGADPASGRQAAQQGVTEALKDPNFTLTFAADRTDASTSGDMAYVQGHFTVTQTDPATHAKVAQNGSYVTVYRKQADGSWRAVADIASPGAPPPTPKKG
jgi:uncharacterized protein (TIGR02246 family)